MCLRSIIRLSLVMAFVSLAALIASYFALLHFDHDQGKLISDWVALRVSMAITVVFIAVAVIAFSKVLRHLRRLNL